MYHTIGQRQGLGIGGLANHEQAPWYVVDKALTRNVLLVAQGNNHPALFKSTLYANDIFWISGQKPDLPLRCTAKIRYRQTDQDCWLEEHAEAASGCGSITHNAPSPRVNRWFFTNRSDA